MKLITKNTCYAIRTLGFLAVHNEGILSVSQIVKNLKIPHSFLRKILQILSKEGIVISYRGQGGGFKLAIPPDKISFIDLINIFQHGPTAKPCSYVGACELRKKIENIQKYVINEFKHLTIKDLLK